jgi:hypothetical protein
MGALKLRKENPGNRAGAEWDMGYLSQGEEHERHDKGSRPSVPPSARKRGHDTRDDQCTRSAVVRQFMEAGLKRAKC